MRLNLRIILLHFFMFLVLLYPFNSSLMLIIYKNANNVVISVGVGIIGLLLFSKKIKFNKNIVLLATYILLFLTMTLVKNGYLESGFQLKVLLYVMYMFLILIIYISPELSKVFCNVIKIFFIEHLVATFAGIFFKDFYKANIISLVCKYNTFCPAAGNYFHGYIPGITSNYSMNAIYLSISTLFLCSEYLENKKKRTLLFLFLSIVGIFVTGKRAHVLFTILCCILLFFVSKRDNKIMKRILYLSSTVFAVTISLFFLSNYIPEIMNVVNRFTLLISKGDLANGRSNLYDLALSLWSKKVIFGNGWGTFSYYYNIYIHNVNAGSFLDAHNIYLQLLCETGIVGALFLIFGMLYSAYSSYKNILCNNSTNKVESIMIKFAFAYQVFFLLYGITGNPLYDHQCYVVYFIVIGYTLYYRFKDKENKYEKNRNNNIL